MTNDNTIIPHVFGDVTIFQVSENTVIAGRVIPKGYCNLTHILKAASAETGKRKQWSNYIKNPNTEEFLEELSKQNNCPIFENTETSVDVTAQPCRFQPLIIAIKGGTPSEQGTWGHLEVALHLSWWASPRLAVWGVKALRAVIDGDFKALTEEAATIQVKLQEQWQSIRDASKEAFWDLGDAITEYKGTHPDKSEAYRRFVFSNCQDCLNRGLFGKDASTIRDELGIKSGELLRDHYGQTALKRIELIQSLAAANIIHRDVEPLEAVKSALAMYNFEVMDYHD